MAKKRQLTEAQKAGLKKGQEALKKKREAQQTQSAKKGGGVKEERHKLGKQAHKAGRPKGGSKVKIVK